VSAPLASVVVPVRNGRDSLAELVSALMAQTLGRECFEVIVADDGSTDGGTDGLASPDGWLRVLPGAARNSYAARNRAARSARAPVLAFCDVDCRPDPRWLELGLHALESADLVAGMVTFQPPPRLTIWAVLDMDTHLDQREMVRKNAATTANLFVRGDVFERAGGFDESIPSGGDADLAQRCVADGARLVAAADAIVSHPARSTAREYLKKIWRIHRSFGERTARARRRAGSRLTGDSRPTDGRARVRGWLTNVPILGPIARHRAAGREVGLNHRRLTESGVTPPLRLELCALLARYGLVFYVERAAFRRGRRAATR
jgi:glycosyltransferase involved in cell wall biosynthesis